MAFRDMLKELLDQGLQASKELAAKAGEKAHVWGEKGLEASREFASKAGAKVQELGEKGVLLLDIKQLEGQIKKLVAGLGAEVYEIYEQGSLSVNFDDEPVKTKLAEIAAVREVLEKREAELKARE